jgi:hypothetical protein
MSKREKALRLKQRISELELLIKNANLRKEKGSRLQQLEKTLGLNKLLLHAIENPECDGTYLAREYAKIHRIRRF